MSQLDDLGAGTTEVLRPKLPGAGYLFKCSFVVFCITTRCEPKLQFAMVWAAPIADLQLASSCTFSEAPSAGKRNLLNDLIFPHERRSAGRCATDVVRHARSCCSRNVNFGHRACRRCG
jgi:hypothetical protein